MVTKTSTNPPAAADPPAADEAGSLPGVPNRLWWVFDPDGYPHSGPYLDEQAAKDVVEGSNRTIVAVAGWWIVYEPPAEG